ncbi:metallophosphoesterase family protein [Dactylosporangium cerinum]
MVALDSQCGVVGGCNPGNPQYQWLLADLNANTKPCTLAYWHIPMFSSSQDHQPDMTSIYTLLYNKNADVVLNGHAHFYERFAPQTVTAAADPARGIAEFIVGSGGRNFFSIRATPSPNSEARIANTFGVLQMTLSDNSYSWQFVGTNAGGSTDSGSASCH